MISKLMIHVNSSESDKSKLATCSRPIQIKLWGILTLEGKRKVGENYTEMKDLVKTYILFKILSRNVAILNILWGFKHFKT